ncbi:MAG TPA: hypothetical protein VN704_06310 [Verrucomicrobiae bacterium]|nr:hypothetical protein [Verrucomicrobiae bacterium]
MRLPIDDKGTNNQFIHLLNKINIDLRKNFESSIKENIQNIKMKVMLADFTVIESETFDPNRVINYFFNKEKELKQFIKWKVAPVQATKTDDLHRVFFQLTLEIDKFYFYIYMGIQFHSLLYYKLDKEIIRINKKIKELEEINSNIKDEITKKGDQIIKQELTNLGYKDIENNELFEELFIKQDLSSSLSEKASNLENSYPQLKQNSQVIDALKKDLENLIIELYQMNPASIDSNKLMVGEEGIAFNIDFELIKNKKKHERTSVIDFEKFTNTDYAKIEREFSDILKTFQ